MIETSAPGRICLFGEHQDYLHLPVITSAINLRVTIKGEPGNDRHVLIDLPDIQSRDSFYFPQDGIALPYTKERDYFRSVHNVLMKHGARFGQGWDCTVRSNIPIQAGTSSSSALCVAWTKFLLKCSSVQKPEFADSAFIGKMAYLAEVEEFGEPGGMMDQNASALGGVLFQDFTEPVVLKKIPVKLGTFVLGDSLEPKDTIALLKRVKFGVLNAVEKIKTKDAGFNLKTIPYQKLDEYRFLLEYGQLQVLRGAVLNRDITRRALPIFESPDFDDQAFGRMLSEHQRVLADFTGISTPKIEAMLRAAEEAGAYGGKINGSGGGGCMFAYAPENPQQVAEAIEEKGGRAYLLQTDEGDENKM